jgi:hypothetical protein
MGEIAQSAYVSKELDVMMKIIESPGKRRYYGNPQKDELAFSAPSSESSSTASTPRGPR